MLVVGSIYLLVPFVLHVFEPQPYDTCIRPPPQADLGKEEFANWKVILAQGNVLMDKILLWIGTNQQPVKGALSIGPNCDL